MTRSSATPGGPPGRRLLLAALAALPAAARAQGGWAPSRSVALVVPFPPGGPTDLVARLLAPALSAELGQPVVVENRSGATGVLGTRHVLAQPADGHTVLVAASGTMTILPVLQRDLGFDPQADFLPLALIVTVPDVIVVHPSVPAEDLAGLIGWMRGQPGGAAYASSGVGSSGHFGMELFRLRAGVPAVHAPFQGAAPAVQAVVAGTVPLAMMNAPTALPHVQAGRLRAIAVAGRRRFAPLPQVPTTEELGLAGIETQSWTAALLRAGTEPRIASRLEAAFARAASAEEPRRRFDALGYTLEARGPADLSRLIAEDLARWRAVAQAAGIRAE
ncbi:MAG: tripartite tricarboxylate transporter substrate-binding protein [Acetobacteraceae bacterium]|nr:tripartite tricarboxylate transporter substrate-binding protein [Acetobacteraceae bacterium]